MSSQKQNQALRLFSLELLSVWTHTTLLGVICLYIYTDINIYITTYLFIFLRLLCVRAQGGGGGGGGAGPSFSSSSPGAGVVDDVEVQIAFVGDWIGIVDMKIGKIEATLGGTGEPYLGITDRARLFKEKDDLVKEKEQLRDEKKLLREKEILLISSRPVAAAAPVLVRARGETRGAVALCGARIGSSSKVQEGAL